MSVWNAREDTFTDEHIEILNLSQLTSLQITKISMKPGHKYLSITDSFFYQLIAVDAFPALMLQLCLVSTTGLASYLKEWIKVHDTDSFSNLTCTLNECPGLSKNDLINECEDLPIQISNNNDYNILIFIEKHPMNIFSINFGGENSKLNFSFTANPKSIKGLSYQKYSNL
uniref:F-box associated domain-containing protein n=1 Tax=Panagrolaimus sp. PS1159 TaxID=55785 RepID=A0AC35FBE7_9BILA